jgi:hypothetical protein
MGRIRKYIELGNKSCWAVFDIGVRNTYIIEDMASDIPTFDLPAPNPVSLGGKIHIVTKYCNLVCKVEGYDVLAHARILDSINTDEEGRKIEVLIGALTMHEWGIRPIPDKEELDMSHYPKEFVEY